MARESERGEGDLEVVVMVVAGKWRSGDNGDCPHNILVGTKRRSTAVRKRKWVDLD